MIKDSYLRALPIHEHTALQKWALVPQEKMASPQGFNSSYLHQWSAGSWDALIGAHLNSPLSQFTGLSVCHPIFNYHTMYLSLRHAIYSAILSTVQLPPSCSYHLGRDPWSQALTLISWQPILTCIMNLIQSQLMRSPMLPFNPGVAKRLLYLRLSGMSIIAVWNTASRLHLNSQPPCTWLQILPGTFLKHTGTLTALLMIPFIMLGLLR